MQADYWKHPLEMNPREQFLPPGSQLLWGPRTSAGAQGHMWAIGADLAPAPTTAEAVGLSLSHCLPLTLVPGSFFISLWVSYTETLSVMCFAP